MTKKLRKVKCGTCATFDDRENMTQNDKGKYYHFGECIYKHLEERKYIEEENRKLDELYQYIRDLHGIPEEVFAGTIKSVMWRIQQLRNGNDVIKGKTEKKYRMGVEYDLLLAAYKLKENDIKWFIDNVLKGGAEAKDINACLSLALKGLSEAWKVQQRDKKREQEKEKMSIQTKADDSHYTVGTSPVVRKSKDDLDISGWL